MMAPERLRVADLLGGSLLALLGLATVLGSLTMPWTGSYGGQPIYWYTSPAFFPFVLGAGLFLLAGGVVRNAIREGAHRRVGSTLGPMLASSEFKTEWRRGLTILALLAGYVAALALHPFGFLAGPLATIPGIYGSSTRFLIEPEGVNYLLTSVLFLLAAFAVFWKISPSRALLAVGVCWFVAWAFTEQLYAPLPW